MEALKATPYKYVQDSLKKHMPLQGTATVPPGEEDMFGRRMSYEGGADLMREADGPGGAYRRYDDVPCHRHWTMPRIRLCLVGNPQTRCERLSTPRTRLPSQSNPYSSSRNTRR